MAVLLNVSIPGDSTGYVQASGIASVSASADSLYRAGELYERERDLARAMDAYEQSSRVLGHHDLTLLLKLATLSTWTRQYGNARAWYERILEIQPANEEATIALKEINTNRSLHIFSTFGSAEVDYARNVRGVGGFMGNVDWLDLYAGYAVSDRLFYQKKSLWSDLYMFPSHDRYVRLGIQYKEYEYFNANVSAPDISAYDQVPDVQLEAGASYGSGNYVSVEAELFRPNFYYNKNMHATNLKLAANVRQSIIHYVYIKGFAAILRDPDPARFVVDGSPGTLNSFEYEWRGLAGAGIGYDDGRTFSEIKYIPDRDLDGSIQWSVFARAGYSWGSFGIRYDLLYDRYAAGQGRALLDSKVNMITLTVSPLHQMEVQSGVKALTRDITELMPFLSLRYKTGL